jgi:tetratricopeptide (TPR) repeat protein
MEWVDGLPIDRWATTGGQGHREVVAMLVQVCDAVAHAHQRGVIHRDLKPSNIMVGADGRPRVLDFGLAKVVGQDGTITRASGFLGTPAYAAPEQVEGAPADTRSDVYALGVVLYELLAGDHPLDTRAAVASVFDQVRRGIRRPPSSRRATVGRELDAIVLKAVALAPPERYSSVHSLADDLRRFLAGQAVSAHPPSTWYRLRTVARRHRALAAACAGAAAILLTSIVVVAFMALRLAGERRKLLTALDSEHAALIDAQAARRAESEAKDEADRSAALAQSALERARADAARSASALEFLRNLIERAGDPRGPRPNVPFRDVLDRAVGQLDSGAAADEPEVEMQLRITVGASYRSLGLFEQAETQMRRALALAEAGHGEDSLQTARALDLLGRMVEYRGRLSESEQHHRRGLAIRERLGTAGTSDYAGSMSDLASVLDEQGRYAESEAMYAEVLDVYLRDKGMTPVRLAVAYRNLGLEQLQLGRYLEAEESTRKALELFGGARRTDSDACYRAQRNLCRILCATGRVDEAVPMMRGVVARWGAPLGKDHPEVARERAVLAGMIAQSGKPEEAFALYAAALKDLRSRLSAQHPWVLRTRVEMARATLAYGSPAAAEALAAEAMSDAMSAPPGAESLAIGAGAVLADALIAEGRTDEALGVVHELVALLGARLGLEDERIALVLTLEREIAVGARAVAISTSPVR